MTPKEKARELFEMFVPLAYSGDTTENPNRTLAIISNAKKCSLNTVQQIIEAIDVTTSHLTLSDLDSNEVNRDFQFWRDVISAIRSIEGLQEEATHE